ncbi:terminase TerL endonuclease subunit [Lawsonibacter faecis]|uniref:Terminase n=1 Tax=Lawsonibacter faecis TaxID=2763052 RepID=A0A8J6J4M6_9FIRM|nr:terminase [Lawsonibacter faecis]
MPETLWLTPFIHVPAPEDGAELRYSPEAVQRVMDFFALLVFGQNEWAGRPFELLPWEEQAIREFYGVQVRDDDGEWVRYRRFLYDEIAKKNGKSEFAAGLGLYHLLCDGETRPQVGVFAADKINADIIYQCAKFMVEHTALSKPAHAPLAWCRDSVREIRTRFGGVMKVYSSEAESKHGFSFSAIIIDELHAQPNRRLWDVLTTGSDAARRQQAVIVLTTAGDDPDRKSIGWEVHEKCRRLLAWRNGEPERELDEDDPQWCPIMYGVSVLTGDDPERIAALDIYDEALWKLCNPSYGVTIKPRQFRAEARAARQNEAAERNFRWLRLNQWIATKDVGWIPLTIYDKTQWGPSAKADREAWLERLRGKKCFGGLDLSTTTDLTALVLLFPPQEGLDTWVALFRAWRPGDGVLEAEQRDHVPYRDWERAGFLELCEGDMIDFVQVEEAAARAAEEYKLLALGVDPYLSRTLTQRLMERGLEVIEIPQTMLSMSPAMKELERLLRAREMRHVHNTCARWCFGNVRCAVDGNENMKPMKNRSIGRIDITVAWIIAMAVALVKMPTGPDINEHVLSEDWGI